MKIQESIEVSELPQEKSLKQLEKEVDMLRTVPDPENVSIAIPSSEEK